MPNGKAENTENKVGTATVKSKSKSYASEISTLGADSENLETTLLEGTPQALAAAAYVPKTWVDGEVIYEDDLNHMEQGIAANAEAIEAVNADLTDLNGFSTYMNNTDDIDLDDLTNGIFCIRNATNAPTTSTWWMVISCVGGSAGCQLAVAINGTSPVIYKRNYGGSWGTWYACNSTSTTSAKDDPVVLE